jgi:hypothetical protein
MVDSQVAWWYRPEINTNAALAAWPTAGDAINSRIEVIYNTGLREYMLESSAADPADPGHVAPNDYDAITNNVHWERKL